MFYVKAIPDGQIPMICATFKTKQLAKECACAIMVKVFSEKFKNSVIAGQLSELLLQKEFDKIEEFWHTEGSILTKEQIGYDDEEV